VEIKEIDFGGVMGIDYLDYILGFPVPFLSAYATMIQSFEAVGYVVGQNLRGVPYDWRLPSDYHLGSLYPRVQQLIEETYTNNGNQKVHVVTHSMGGPTFLYFLNHMSQAWKDTYIESFIPIAGPWSGSPKALRALISGDNFGLEVLGFSLADKLLLRSAVRTAGGPISLVPDPLFWDKRVFVYTPEKNYTSWEFQALFKRLNAETTAQIYPKVQWLMANMTAPFVPTYCIYGTHHKTEMSFHYDTADFNSDPSSTEFSDEGDGTVPLQSLQECGAWKEFQPDVIVKEFDVGSHVDIISTEHVIHYVLDIITGQNGTYTTK